MQRIPLVASSLSILLLAGCASGAGTAGAGAEAPNAAGYAVADPVAEADALSQEAARLFDVPGMAVAIVVGDEVVFSRGYGALDVTREAGTAGANAVNDATSFAIASNTKAFTATALGLLVADGEIGWDDRVVEHLPTLKLWDDYVTRELRVRDLLSHRVGLSTWAGDLMWLSSNYDRDTILARLQHLPPDFSFRERYGYCNLMFMVAGELIEQKTGERWDAFIKTRILDPLGMADVATRVGQLDGKDNVATAHIEVDGAWTTTPYLDLEAVGPAASFHANVLDLSRWVRMQLADGTFEGTQVVPKAVIFETRQPHIWLPLGEEDYMEPRRHLLGYGLGWYLADYRGELLVTHGGGMPGMTSRVLMFPESDVGVIVLTSSESPASSALAMNLADLYLAGAGDPRKNYVTAAHERMLAAKAEDDAGGADKKPAPALTGAPPEELLGEWNNPILGGGVVRREDTGVWFEVPDHGGLRCQLFAASESGEDGKPAAVPCQWTDPNMKVSTFALERENGEVRSLSFKVRPDFYDPLEYTYTR